MKSFALAAQQTFLEKSEYIFGFVLIFLMPQLTAFIAVGALIIFDTITGVWASVKIGGWKSIQSKRLKDTITKFIMYNLLIVTCMIVESFLITRIPFIEVGLGIIATVETKSIFENIEKVLNIKIVSAFKEILHKGRKQQKTK